MLPVIVSAGGFRLLVGALPITVLIIFFGLLAGFAMVMPKDQREYVLKLAPHLLAASRAIAAIPAARESDDE
jgi:hypothetical protein